MKLFKTMTAVAALALSAGTASAQWVINEIVTETTGPNVNFIELYNPTPNASVNGLTVLNIRSSTGIAVSAINLTGNATGNYYLIANTLYDDFNLLMTPPQPEPDALLTLSFRGQYHQTLLVNTIDLPPGFLAGAAGYDFDAVPPISDEFSNGTLIIDSVQFTDGTTDPEFFPTQNEKVVDSFQNAVAPFEDSPYGAGRFPDGAATWASYPLPLANEVGPEATPKATNTFASVADWSIFN